jgi:hypothetical protein
MRFTFGIIFLLALLCGVVAAQDPPPPVKEYSANAWKEFSSAEGRFSISLPGTPKAEVRTLDAPIGKLSIHFFTLETDLGQYYIDYKDFPVAPTTPEEIKEALDSSRDKALAGGARLLVENDVSMAGVVARELLVQKGDFTLRARFFFVKSRSYQLILGTLPNVVFKNAKPSANAADRTDLFEMVSRKFFDSFKVTP